jgi:hypothetical protein
MVTVILQYIPNCMLLANNGHIQSAMPFFCFAYLDSLHNLLASAGEPEGKIEAGHVREAKEMRCREITKYNVNFCSIFLNCKVCKRKAYPVRLFKPVKTVFEVMSAKVLKNL